MRLWRCAFSIKFLYPNSHLTFLANSSVPFSLFKNIQFIDRIFNVQKDFSAFLEEFDTPARLHLCVVIAAEEGVAHLARVFPSDDVTLWCAAIDPVLNEAAYIVPGLGDAGDLSFGPKKNLR